MKKPIQELTHIEIPLAGNFPLGVRFDYAGRPAVENSIKSRPSWKTTGDGVKYAKLILQPDGSLDIQAAEWPETARGGKEVYVMLDPAHTEQLFQTLLAARAKTAKPAQIVVVVRGGCAQGVYSTDPNVKCEILDCDGDNKDENEPKVEFLDVNPDFHAINLG